MIASIAFNIDDTLTAINMARAVLDAAIDRATSCEKVKPENGTGCMWQQEVAEINKLMTAVSLLISAPMEKLEDIKGAAWQLVEESKGGDLA